MSANPELRPQRRGIDAWARAQVWTALRSEVLTDAGSVVSLTHRPRDFYLRRMLATADGVAMCIGLLAMSALLPHGTSFPGHLLWGFVAVPAWLVLFHAYGLYSWDMRRVGHTTVDELPGVAHAVLLGAVALWGFFQLTPAGKVPFAGLFALALTVLVSSVLLRTAARSLGRRLVGSERVLFVGSGPMTPLLVEKMKTRTRYGLEPVGALMRSGESNELGVPVLGDVTADALVSAAAQWHVDRVVVSTQELADASVADLLRRCRQLSLKVSIVPTDFGLIGPSAEVDHLEGIAMIGVNPPVLSRSARITKRLIDIVGAGAALLILAPVLAAVGLAVKLSSPGPVFFRQRRIGAASESFEVIKFRTMFADAEARQGELMHLSKDPNWLHLEHDPRITRVGRFLRHTSIDELPQLWNVLRGDMSLVGPRPLSEVDDSRVDGWQRGRLDLTPGITGLWQVLGRTEIPFEEMVKLDYLYVTNWSLWGDVRLILRTVGVVVSRSGAN